VNSSALLTYYGGISVDKQKTDQVYLNEEVGCIKISDEVVATIAGLAATEIEGVAGMSGGLMGDISEVLGKKSLSKGVKVDVGEKEAAIDLYIIIEYGMRIPEVAERVQDNVKRSVEVMTGLKVVEVNIHVSGITFKSEGKEDEARVR
jgi:uncharacterized alkaline shock family protein YloU